MSGMLEKKRQAQGIYEEQPEPSPNILTEDIDPEAEASEDSKRNALSKAISAFGTSMGAEGPKPAGITSGLGGFALPEPVPMQSKYMALRKRYGLE